MNAALIAQRFAKSADMYEKEATVQWRIAEKMTTLLERYYDRKGGNILEIGCGTGIFSRMLIETLKPEKMLLNDLCSEMCGQVKDVFSNNIKFCAGDAQTYPFTGRYGVIASCSTIQWFKKPEDFILRMCLLLETEGIIALSTFGEDNMKEISALTGQGLDYLSLEEWEELLPKHYELLHISEEKILKYFTHPKEVLYHMKRTGVTGVTQHRWTRTKLKDFYDRYVHSFKTSEGVMLTYHPIYVIARKKE